jgi:acyl-CoA thioesterase-1
MILKRLMTAVLLVAWAYPLHANTVNKTIVVLGDSLSAGFGLEMRESWVSLLQQKLSAEGYGYQVVNASISGDTTSGGLARLPRVLEQQRPGIVIVELGGNDGLRGLPVQRLRANLQEMISLASDAGARVVLAGIQIPPNYGMAYARSFAEVYPQVAQENGVALIEFILEDVALDPKLMQADGIHPNAAGQPIILDTVWSVLAELL